MENETKVVKPEAPDKPLEIPYQSIDSPVQNQDIGQSPKKASKTKALLLIFIPILFWAISFGLMFSDRQVPVTSPSTDPYAVVEVKQNPIAPIFNILNFVLGPFLLIMLIYGIVLLVRSPKPVINTNVSGPTNTMTKPPSYKVSTVTFIVGVALLLIAFLIVHNIRSDVGYSGSEAEIGSFPFIFSGGITIVVSIIMYISTMIRRIAYEKRNRA